MFNSVYPVPAPAPYALAPFPQPPAVRSAALPPIVAPAASQATRYKAAVAPQFTPSGYAASHQVRPGSGLRINSMG